MVAVLVSSFTKLTSSTAASSSSSVATTMTSSVVEHDQDSDLNNENRTPTASATLTSTTNGKKLRTRKTRNRRQKMASIGVETMRNMMTTHSLSTSKPTTCTSISDIAAPAALQATPVSYYDQRRRERERENSLQQPSPIREGGEQEQEVEENSMPPPAIITTTYSPYQQQKDESVVAATTSVLSLSSQTNIALSLSVNNTIIPQADEGIVDDYDNDDNDWGVFVSFNQEEEDAQDREYNNYCPCVC